MAKQRMTNAERLHRAFGAGAAFFVLVLVAFKLGYRGRKPIDLATSWADVAATVPSLLVLSALIGWCVYFWIGRRP
jgi:hypothetical protein